MKLQDFLKCKKVRCVKGYGRHLTVGETYHVLGLSVPNNLVQVENDNGFITEYDFGSFEPVTDLSKSAENPPQDMKLTPEFEAVEPVIADNCEVNIQDNSVNTKDNSVNIQDTPKFKVGDPVYCPSLLDGRIYKARKNNNYLGDGCKLFVANEHEDCFDFEVDGSNQYNNPIVYHANEETRQALQVLHPDIEFEQPPKPLSGDELVRAMLTKGIKNVLCLWGSGDKIIIDRLDYKGSLMSTNCNIVGGLTPIDWYTGEPLTQEVLDE